MRLTELLGIQTEPETKTINQDGKQYKFTPGKQGSLIVENPPKAPRALDQIQNNVPKAKIVPQVGSVRG